MDTVYTHFSLVVILCVMSDLSGFCKSLAVSEQHLGWMPLQNNRRCWEVTADFQNSKSLATLKLSAEKKLICRPMYVTATKLFDQYLKYVKTS